MKNWSKKVIQIVLNQTIEIRHYETQADLKGLNGSKSIRGNVLVIDTNNTIYNIEVQRNLSQAIPERLRYYGSRIDVSYLKGGMEYKEIPYIKQMKYEPFNDRIYFMYINGQYTGEDELGYLMHDFNCSDYRDMILEEMRESVKKLKTNENEVENMCQIMEELVENGRLQGLNEGILQGNLKGKLEKSISTAHNLYEMGLGLDQIAKALDSDINQVKK